jgi:hypothetical protein
MAHNFLKFDLLEILWLEARSCKYRLFQSNDIYIFNVNLEQKLFDTLCPFWKIAGVYTRVSPNIFEINQSSTAAKRPLACFFLKKQIINASF